jgi:hypothetical protein
VATLRAAFQLHDQVVKLVTALSQLDDKLVAHFGQQCLKNFYIWLYTGHTFSVFCKNPARKNINRQ